MSRQQYATRSSSSAPVKAATPAPHPKSAPVITVENLKPVHKFGSVKAFCSISIGGFKIHDLKIVQVEDKDAWVALPSARYEVNGQTKYKTIVEVPEHIMAAISSAVLNAWSQR